MRTRLHLHAPTTDHRIQPHLHPKSPLTTHHTQPTSPARLANNINRYLASFSRFFFFLLSSILGKIPQTKTIGSSSVITSTPIASPSSGHRPRLATSACNPSADLIRILRASTQSTYLPPLQQRAHTPTLFALNCHHHPPHHRRVPHPRSNPPLTHIRRVSRSHPSES